MDTRKLQKYLLKNAGKAGLKPVPNRLCPRAVVIPSYAESSFLSGTLRSLALNPPEYMSGTMIFIVLNNPSVKICDPEKYRDNLQTLESIEKIRTEFSGIMNIYVVDAFTEGNEIDPQEGVGAARRIGMDIALKYLDWTQDPIIISLDADTLVESNYIEAIDEFFRSSTAADGAWIHFEHQESPDADEAAAISSYEILIRYYVWGLRFARSPYAYYTLGSAMAFRASAYVSAGGMRKRNGGEDFYFMEALAKFAEIGGITNTCVHPSSRASDRVPFGTGPKIRELKASDLRDQVYNHRVFLLLRELMLKSFSLLPESRIDGPGKFMKSLDPLTSEYLEICGFPSAWPKILKNTPEKPAKTIAAFNVWFDALRTLQFIHFCESREENRFRKEKNILAFHDLFMKNAEDERFRHIDQMSEIELLHFLRGIERQT